MMYSLNLSQQTSYPTKFCSFTIPCIIYLPCGSINVVITFFRCDLFIQVWEDCFFLIFISVQKIVQCVSYANILKFATRDHGSQALSSGFLEGYHVQLQCQIGLFLNSEWPVYTTTLPLCWSIFKSQLVLHQWQIQDTSLNVDHQDSHSAWVRHDSIAPCQFAALTDISHSCVIQVFGTLPSRQYHYQHYVNKFTFKFQAGIPETASYVWRFCLAL